MKTKMKLIFTIILVLITVLASGIFALTKNEHTKSFTVQRNGSLQVNINPGDVTITTWDKLEVLIKLKGVDEEEIKNEIKLEQKGNTIYVESQSSWGWMGDAEYNISVPREFNLEIKTTSGDIDLRGNLKGDFKVSTAGGDVSFKDVEGNVTVYSSGGDIISGDITGSLKLDTQGGDITLGNVSGTEASVNTMGGDILIQNVKSNVEVKTYGGDIKIGDIGGNANAVTYGGDIELNKVSGGANCETYGGNISLKGASGEVKANTYGGNLKLLNVTGRVNANTQAGNIYVELLPSGKGNSKLSSSSGKITLAIPSESRVSIVAEISLRGWWKEAADEMNINSDFEAKKYEKSADGKEIRAEYELNGGGEKISIETVNSEIFIKKLK